MSDDRDQSGPSTHSWFERLRLNRFFVTEPRDRGELIDWLRTAERRDLFDAEALAMIEGALQVGEMQVRDIMVPRAQMVVVEASRSPEEFIAEVTESGHSRFPVVGDNRDEVEGILLAKDLLAYFVRRDDSAFDMDDVMRPVVYIPESKRLNVLLREFRASRNHMAIVVDEYSGVSGLITIEDVLEQIVGEIEDEHDIDEGEYVRRHANGEFAVKAHTPIEDFNEYFGTTYSDDEFDTIAGLVIRAFGRLPKRGEDVTVDGMRFMVVRADKRRVHLLRVLPVDAGRDVGVSES